MTGKRPQPRDDLALVDGYHSPQVDVSVRLNTNEAPGPPPAELVEQWRAGLARLDLHRYPDRTATELRGRLGALHGVDPDQILVGNGSNEVIQAVCLTYGGPGRRALVFEPTYAMHSHISRIAGTEVVEAARQPDFTIDADAARSAIAEHQPDIVFLCSPNNPTGRIEPAGVIEAVLADAPGVVVVDEAYGQFAPSSAVDLLSEDRPLVVTRTYSKTWAMAALRLGYLLGPRWLVDELGKVTLPYNVDASKQLAGRLALDHVAAMEERVAAIVAERDRVSVRLAELGCAVVPSAANFVLFAPPGDAHETWRALLERDVLVRDTSAWPRLDGHLRATIGTPEDDDAFLSALAEVIE